MADWENAQTVGNPSFKAKNSQLASSSQLQTIEDRANESGAQFQGICLRCVYESPKNHKSF